MSEKMKENYIIDKIDFQIPNTMVDEIKKQAVIIDHEGINKFLEIEVDATHGGYVNQNYYCYSLDGQARGAISFIKPFQKPVLPQHIPDATPIGRVVASAFIPLAVDGDDLQTPKSKIRLKAVITDQKAIEDILTKRYFTVSTGGSSKEPPRCSICNEPITSLGPLGSVPGCEHHRGQSYEIGDKKEKKLCYWNIGEMEYKEVSFVNMPADYTPDHVASITSMRWVDTVDPQDSVTVDSTSSIKDSEKSPEQKNEDQKKTKCVCPKCGAKTTGKGTCFGEKCPKCGASMKFSKDDKDKEDKGGDIMSKKLLDEFLASLAVLDECEDCNEDCGEEWKEETEIKEAEELSKEFIEFIGEDVEYVEETEEIDDKKLPPAGSKARKKMKTTFCGPNKTFPIPDCKHASVALAMLNWPRVKAKYSASVRARIASCVRGRAKTLGCPMAKKKKDAEEQAAIKKTQDMEKQIADLNTQIQEKDAQIQKANEQITQLSAEVKTRLAEKVVDLSIMSKRGMVSDIMETEDKDEREKAYKTHVKTLIERSDESLQDSIKDLTAEVQYTSIFDEKIDHPHTTEENKDKKVNKKEGQETDHKKKIVSLIFG